MKTQIQFTTSSYYTRTLIHHLTALFSALKANNKVCSNYMDELLVQ